MRKRPLAPAQDDQRVQLRNILTFLAVWVLAFVTRLVYLQQLKRSPLFEVLMGDAAGYDAWAREIAGGDWLGKTVFYQAPLYPYFLGTWYSIAGTSRWTLSLLQILLGATSCVWLGMAGRRFFSPAVGTIAAVFLALYPSAIYFDVLVQKTVLDSFLVTLLLFLLSLLTLRPSRPFVWFLTGLTLAWLALSRENALVLPVVIGGWSSVFFRYHSWRHRLQWVALMILGMAILLLPVGWRNYHVGGGFRLTTSQFGPNLYIGNNPNANGRYVPLRAGHGNVVYERRDATDLAEEKVGKQLSPAEVSSFWTNEAVGYVRQHPTDWLRLLARKFFFTWNAYEISDTDDQYLASRWSPLLRFVTRVFHFGVICPMAAVGIALWHDRRRVWLLYLMLAAYALSVIVFYVLARYRYPLVPILLLFAAAGVIEVYRRLRKNDLFGLTLAGIIAVITGAFVNWPTGVANDLNATALYNLGVAQLKLGRLEEAAEFSRQALKVNPNHWGAHNTLGRVDAARRDHVAAAAEFQQALQLAPQSAELHNNLGDSYVELHRLADAANEFREAIRLDANSAEPHNGLAVALVGMGQLDEAGNEFRRAMELKPEWPDAKRNYDLLQQLQSQRGAK
jgi:Tfp pilus assembly protein PilF